MCVNKRATIGYNYKAYTNSIQFFHRRYILNKEATIVGEILEHKIFL